MKKTSLILAIILLFIQSGFSQTNVSGGIFSNTTWDLAGSPYIVTANVIVMTGVTLTILPGVNVRFQDATGLEIRGDMIAIGTVTDSIIFTSNSNFPTPGIWNDITFEKDLTLKYVRISYAMTGLYNLNSSILTISKSKFSNNMSGVLQLGNGAGYGSVDSTVFEGNKWAISASDADYISYCSFVNNFEGVSGGMYGTLLSYCTFTGNTNCAVNGVGANYHDNIITNNNTGLSIKLYNSNFVISNNIITNNQIGVYAEGDATSTPNTGFTNNTICNNSVYDVKLKNNVSVYLYNNCWCTNDSTTIASHIFDAYDDLNLGIVYYSPYINNCGLGTDDLLIETSSSLFPNPFNDFTMLSFENPRNEKTTLSIFNIEGKEVQKISEITSDRMRIEKGNLSGGIYFYQLRSERALISNGKMIVE